MALKSQDFFVTLRLAANGPRTAYARLASELGMSASEVHASVKRAEMAGLLHGAEMNHRPNFASIEEFLVHGLKYAFPASRGGMTRGVPTSYAAEPLRRIVEAGSEPIPVWPSETGTKRGIALQPLYRRAPAAALRDATFYQYLTLADALRDGRMRERKYAEIELRNRLREASEKLRAESSY